MKIIVYFILGFTLTICSCKGLEENEGAESLAELLKYEVEGGYHQPHMLGSTQSPYGYYFFTPQSAVDSKEEYPLLIFLHGSGQIGNSQTNPLELDKVLATGLSRLITKGTWNPSVKMLVATPQCHGTWWNRTMIKEFIEYLMKTYKKVDQSRIYLTGLSMGGYATFDYLGKYGNESYIAAAVPICGSGVFGEPATFNLSKIPLWVFHGEADQTVTPDYSKAIVPAINVLNPPVKAKLTLYPGVGHDSWTMTYGGSGMGKENHAYDRFNQDIYSWMNQYEK
jgi:poly(3-hydroxybutyrate) depolymerase